MGINQAGLQTAGYRTLCLLVLLAGCLFCTAPVQAMQPIQHWQTDNGARVYFVPAPELPIVDVGITFAAGSARDDGKPGVAQMTSMLLDKGAAGLSADEIAIRAEALGAKLSTGSARDMGWLTLRSLADPAHLQPALAIFRDVLSKPDFKKKDFKRERERLLVSLRRGEQSPSTIAGYQFYYATFGEHPYAARPEGTEESLTKLVPKDLRAYHDRYYVARNAVVTIVGDLDRKAAGTLAAELLSGLPAGARATPVPPVPLLEKASEKQIFHPSSQTHVRMGAPLVRRGDPDYFPLYVGNHILGGGGLVSRLFKEVREDRGLSYGVSSAFSPMEQAGPYTLSLQTKNTQVDEAIAVLRQTLQTFIEEGPTDAEVVAAKKNITGGFPLRIESNTSIREYVNMIAFYDLPLDYLETFNDKVTAVTREQIMDAFKRRVQPDRMATVIVGGEP
ncbi:MAG: pitrilysin family protein [Gammaproteobacteria bacterium]